MHISGGVLFRGISDLPQGNVHHLREEDQDDQGQQQENHQCNIGNVQHAVAGFLDPQHVAVDDHIALYPVIVCDGRENAEHFRVEIAEEVIDHIVGGPGGGGVEIFDDDLVFNIQGHSRIQHQAAGGVDNADGGVQIHGQGVQLVFHGLQIRLAGIQSCRIGVGDAGGLHIEVFRFLPDQMLPGHTGHKGSDNDEAEQAEDEVSQYELQVEGLFHVLRTSNL